jgi:hypothetical protein
MESSEETAHTNDKGLNTSSPASEKMPLHQISDQNIMVLNENLDKLNKNLTKLLSKAQNSHSGKCKPRAQYTFNGKCFNCSQKGHRRFECPFPTRNVETTRRFSDVDENVKISPMDVVPKHSLDQGSQMSKMFNSAQLHKHDTVTTTILAPVHIADFTKPVCQRKPHLNTINSNHHFNPRYSERAVHNGTSPQ